MNRSTIEIVRLDAMIEEATVDCYNEAEQVTGLLAMIEEHLMMPFETRVLGAKVEVRHVDLTDDDQVVAVCVRGEHSQTIALADLPLPTPLPDGAEWIEAYRRWLR